MGSGQQSCRLSKSRRVMYYRYLFVGHTASFCIGTFFIFACEFCASPNGEILMSDGEEEEIHGWVCLKTEDGKPYYYNPDLNKTQWDPPEEGFITLDDDEEEVEEEGSSSDEDEANAAADHPYADPSSGYDDVPSAPASGSRAAAVPRTSSKRRVCRWEMKKTASFGAGHGTDAGDVYYLNKETGETVWEKPDDYFDDSAADNLRKVESLADITEETTLAEGFDVLDIYGDQLPS